MRTGGFELNEPLPELNSPHVIAVLRPWIDAGEVGTMILERLEANMGARELGKLATPGNFYDFTRYRPTVRWIDDVRELWERRTCGIEGVILGRALYDRKLDFDDLRRKMLSWQPEV